MTKFTASSKKNPCPVCGREKDGDCRVSEDEGLVLCHTEVNHRKKGDELNGHIFWGTDEGGLWGRWILKKGEFTKERPAGKEIRYPFYNREGKIAVEEVRIYSSDGSKKAWMDPKGIDTSSLVPYRYKEALQALKDGAPNCFFVEGPPKADSLWDLGLPAIAFANGFKESRDSSWFEGFEAQIIVVPDQDRPGVEKAAKIAKAYSMARSFRPWAESARWEPAWIPDGGGRDVKDWIDELKRQGKSKEHIIGLILERQEPRAVSKESKGRPEKSQRLTFEQLIEAMRGLEICHGFLTSKYMWALENFAEDIKRPAKFLQSVYNRSLSETCDVKDETFAEVSKQSPEEIPWLIPDMLYRGATTIFHAAGGCGKTLLVYNLIKALSVTGEFLGVPTTEKVRCGLIQIDEPKPAFTERIKELQMDETDNLVKLDWSFGLVSSLDKWITDNNLGLVVIDSFFAAQKFAETKENDSDHAAVLMRLRDIAQRTNSSIVIIHHSNKQGGVRGSGAIPGAVSEIWHLTKPDPEKHGHYKLKPSERIFECEKTRMITPFKLALELDGDSLTWRNLGDLTKIDNGTIEEPATPSDRIKAFINSASTPFTISDLIDNRVLSVGVSRDAARLILFKLKKKGFVLALEQSSGKTETKWISPRFYKKGETVETVSTQTHTEQGNQTVSVTVSPTVSQPFQSLGETVVEPFQSLGETVTETVGETVLSLYTASDTDQPFQPFHQKSEILERIQKTEKSTYVPRPSSEYTGPPVGSIVRFSDQGVAAKEIKALQQRGINYPWGLTGRISDVFATTGNRYAATVTTDDLGTYTVRDFLALEVLELPEEAHKVSSADQPWDDSTQPDLEW